MKTFRGYLTEITGQKSTSDILFDDVTSSAELKIPMSGTMLKRIWPDTIRTTAFHVFSAEDIYDLKKLEGKKKSISAFFHMQTDTIEAGVAAGGGVVAELEGDILVSSDTDIMSEIDKTGRRWIPMLYLRGERGEHASKMRSIEKDLDTLISDLVKKHLNPGFGGALTYSLWRDMKKRLKGDGKILRVVIKDYFDGVEKIFTKKAKVIGDILYDYAKTSRKTDYAWDEQVINNIKIKKIHYLPDELESDEQENVDAFLELYSKIPSKSWDSGAMLQQYTSDITKK